MFQGCITRYAPQFYNAAFTAQYPNLFPLDAGGKPTNDHIGTLLDLDADPTRVPEGLSLRSLGAFPAQGEGKYMRTSTAGAWRRKHQEQQPT